MKNIRKLKKYGTAVAGTALLVGATLTGAAAQTGGSSGSSTTLGDFPQPFVDDSGMVQSSIVVGEDAATADVVGAIDVAGVVGQEAFTTEMVSSGSSIDGKSYKTGVWKDVFSGSDLLDKSDFSKLLRKTVTDGNDEQHFVVEKAGLDTDNGGPVSTDVNGSNVLTDVPAGAVDYEVSYTPGFSKNQEVSILGESYMITELTKASNNEVKLGTEMSKDKLALDETYKHGPYTIKVEDFNKDKNTVLVQVSKEGKQLEMKALDSGESFTVDNNKLNVSADSIYFGSQDDYISLSSTYTDTVLTEGEKLPQDSGYKVQSINLNSAGDELQGLEATNVRHTADKPGNTDTEDDVKQLEEGESFEGPAGYFQVNFEGLEDVSTTDIEVKDGYEVTYTDTGGFDHTLNITDVASSVGSGELTATNQWTSTGGVRFYDVSSGNEWGADTNDVIVTDDDHDGKYTNTGDSVTYTGQDSPSNTDSLYQFSNSVFFVNDGSNDGSSTSGYQAGDEVYSSNTVHDGTTSISDGSTVYTFPSTTGFIDDGTEVSSGTSGAYDDGDDLYTISQHVGSSTPSDSGTTYQSFQASTEFINAPASSSATFDGSQDVITGASNTLTSLSNIQHDGSASVLTGLAGTNYQIHEDSAAGSAGYEGDGSGGYGEAIYNTGGDGTIDNGDARVTSVTVKAGSDTDINSVNLGLNAFQQITSSTVPENSQPLTAYTGQIAYIDPTTGTVEYDPATENDDVYWDADSSGDVSPGDVVLTNQGARSGVNVGEKVDSGDGVVGTALQTSFPAVDTSVGAFLADNSGGSAGTYESGDKVVINLDDDNGSTGAQVDDAGDVILTGTGGGQFVTNAGVTFSASNADVTLSNAAFKYWDAESDSTYNSGSSNSGVSDDGVFLENDTTATNSVNPTDVDVRVANDWTKTYSSSSTVDSNGTYPDDVDRGVSVTDFANSNYYLNDDNTGGYDNGELIVDSSDADLNPSGTDSVIVSGSISNTRTDFETGSDSGTGTTVDLWEGSGTYGGGNVISVTSSYGTTSSTVNTENVGAGNTVSLTGFQTGSGNVEGFVSSSSTYTDDEDIVRLSKFSATSSTALSVGDGSSVTVNNFASDMRHLNSGSYVDDDSIIDDAGGQGTFSSSQDTELAGSGASSINGNNLQASNPWTTSNNVNSPVSFIDSGGTGSWNSNDDLVAVDEDDNGIYSSGTDTKLAGVEPSGSTGLFEVGSDRTVFTDVSGHPVKVEWDQDKGEATVSYESFSRTVSSTGTKNFETGYGFSFTLEYGDLDNDNAKEIDVTGSDSTLNAQYGAISYTSGSPSIVALDEDGSGVVDNDEPQVAFDGSDQIAGVTSGNNKIELLTEDSASYSDYGTLMELGSDKSPVSFNVPEEKREAVHAVGGEGAKNSDGQEVSSPAGWPSTGSLDSGANRDQDLILVGGPAINDLTQDLAENDQTRSANEWQTGGHEGTSILQLTEGFDGEGGNKALVVAGHGAEDTRTASEFLANYGDHSDALEGESQVEISTETGNVVQ